MGFRASGTTKNVSVNINALGGQARFTPTGASASVEVARIEVKTDKPIGIFTGSFKAEALSASANFGLQGDLAGAKTNVNNTTKTSSSGITVFAVGAEANVAKTTVSSGIKLGPVNIQLSGSVGYGAAANASIGAGKSGFGVSATAGLGATVGLGLKVTWDSGKVDSAIRQATASVNKPAPTPIGTATPASRATTRPVMTAD
jgi:hypothetical protein